jgi:hypothetical protein
VRDRRVTAERTKKLTPDPRAIDRSRGVQGGNLCVLASARRRALFTDRVGSQETR